MRNTRKRTAILISGRGSNMEALIEAARSPEYPAEIALVLSNRPDAPGLATARKTGVAVAAIDHKIFAGREDFERSMQALLDIHRIELICMAGFMRLVTPWFIGQWQGRVINIHPALDTGQSRVRRHTGARIAGPHRAAGSAPVSSTVLFRLAVAVLVLIGTGLLLASVLRGPKPRDNDGPVVPTTDVPVTAR